MVILQGRIILRGVENYKSTLLFDSENNNGNFLIHFHEDKKDSNYPFLSHRLSEEELLKLKILIDNALEIKEQCNYCKKEFNCNLPFCCEETALRGARLFSKSIKNCFK